MKIEYHNEGGVEGLILISESVNDRALLDKIKDGAGTITKRSGKVYFQSTKPVRSLPEYDAWKGMLARCRNVRNRAWRHYGGRGISVCERWLSFAAFFADMGAKPSAGHSLDRINVDGNYEPSNCRWATWSEQRRNQRPHRLRFVEVDGRRMLLIDACEAIGADIKLVSSRITMGWTFQRAVETPRGPNPKVAYQVLHQELGWKPSETN